MVLIFGRKQEFSLRLGGEEIDLKGFLGEKWKGKTKRRENLSSVLRRTECHCLRNVATLLPNAQNVCFI